MADIGRLYEFVYRATLTEEALDKAGRRLSRVTDESMADIAAALSLELLDAEEIAAANRMAVVYTGIAAFENAARRFVSRVLQDGHGDNWWEECVSEKIRKFAESRREDEERTKWHGMRGDNLMNYTELGHLVNIMQNNWIDFEAHVRRVDWATSIFGSIERSRNVIMHSGILEIEDVERVGIQIRDWVKQVGG
jgi:hypothetical protein